MAAVAGPELARRHDQHDGAGGLRDRARGRSSTTPSSTSRTSCGGLRRPRSMATRRRPRRSSCDSSLEVRSAIVYATLIEVVAVLAGVLHQRAAGRVLPATGDLPTAWRSWRRSSWRLTVTPALALILLCAARRSSARRSPFARVLHVGYTRLITPVVRTTVPAVRSPVGIAAVSASLVYAARWASRCSLTSRSATSSCIG